MNPVYYWSFTGSWPWEKTLDESSVFFFLAVIVVVVVVGGLIACWKEKEDE